MMVANVLLFHFYVEPHPPTNLSAVMQCKQGYEIQIHWQVRKHTVYLHRKTTANNKMLWLLHCYSF